VLGYLFEVAVRGFSGFAVRFVFGGGLPRAVLGYLFEVAVRGFSGFSVRFVFGVFSLHPCRFAVHPPSVIVTIPRHVFDPNEM
jgi:hypothetical protein